MSLLTELKRRNVFRVGAAYAVVAWVLLQLGDILFESLELPGTWSKGLIALLALGFIPALVLSWIYELTPEGLQKESDLTEAPGRAHAARKLDLVVIAFVLLGIGFLLADRFWFPEMGSGSFTSQTRVTPPPTVNEPDPFKEAPEASIAVLPFTDLSPEGDQQYFSDGITEEILNVLVRVDGLSVASRTSAFRFRSEDKSIPTIAQELGVAHVLEGSVRKAGDRIRVTAQLIAADEDVHLWSETFDRDLTLENIFEIQDEIASEIVEVLSSRFSETSLGKVETLEKAVANLDAYELYQRANNLPGKFDMSRVQKKIELAERATELAPDYVEAWTMLAINYSVLPGWSPEYDIEEWQVKAMAAVERALALDPDSAPALSVRGRIHSNLKQWAKANQDLRTAWEMEPDDPDVAFNYGVVLLEEGYIKQALGPLRRAQEINVDNGFDWMFYGMALAADGQDDLALETLTHGFVLGYRGSIEPEISALHLRRGDVEAFAYVIANWYERSRYADLARYVIRARLSPPDRKKDAIDQFWRVAGELGFDLEYMLERSSRWANDGLPFQHAVWLGHDEVLAGTWPSIAQAFMWGPGLGEGRQTEGFRQMLRIAGLPDFWRENGWPDKCRPLADDNFECE